MGVLCACMKTYHVCLFSLKKKYCGLATYNILKKKQGLDRVCKSLEHRLLLQKAQCGSQYSYSSLQLAATPVLRDLLPSSNLLGHHVHRFIKRKGNFPKELSSNGPIYVHSILSCPLRPLLQTLLFLNNVWQFYLLWLYSKTESGFTLYFWSS